MTSSLRSILSPKNSAVASVITAVGVTALTGMLSRPSSQARPWVRPMTVALEGRVVQRERHPVDRGRQIRERGARMIDDATSEADQIAALYRVVRSAYEQNPSASRRGWQQRRCSPL